MTSIEWSDMSASTSRSIHGAMRSGTPASRASAVISRSTSIASAGLFSTNATICGADERARVAAARDALAVHCV